MASGIADFGASTWLAAVFGVVDPSAGYWIALCSDEPGPAADGDTLADLEPAAETAYRRIHYLAGPDNWEVDGTFLTNLLPVVFPLPFEDWGRLTHYALCTAATSGSLYAWGVFTNPQNVLAGYSMIIPPGGIVVSLTSVDNSIAI